MFRRNAALWLIVGALVGVATPALAAKGGNGGSSSTTSTIAIATVDGTSLAAATVKPTPKLGDTLTFATTVEPLAGWEYPMVVVSCYQDVNGDGTVDTNLLGPDIVYSWLDKPTATFMLGGYSSIWTERGGGAAMCRADLDAYGWKSGKESIRVLASTLDWPAQG
jgi:hypothetical protein